MNLTYLAKLILKVQNTEVDTKKIDSFFKKTYNMVIAIFYIFNKPNSLQFF